MLTVSHKALSIEILITASLRPQPPATNYVTMLIMLGHLYVVFC